MDIYRAHVLCCGGTGCSSSGSAQLIERFEQKIAENGLEKEVKVIRTGCFGLCEAGPVVIVYRGDHLLRQAPGAVCGEVCMDGNGKKRERPRA